MPVPFLAPFCHHLHGRLPLHPNNRQRKTAAQGGLTALHLGGGHRALDDNDHAPGRDGYVSSITPVRGQYVQHLLQRLSSRKCELLERLSAVHV
jgi:hypothetical protein